ncbi:MAG TPA: DUF6452 family protein [Flavobacterium sp.]|nr:DUF6452 family protein [Flavobacterium sp.]
MNKLFLSKILLFIAILVLALLLWNCEKDDICDPNTPTTPRLIIGFYDVNEPDEPKSATLEVVADNITDAEILRFSSATEIEIPLDITQDYVRYKFTLNAGSTNPDLIYSDIIEFNYSRTTTYVSRACGFKITFDLNNDVDLPSPFVLNFNPAVVPGAWIKNITVENYNIENETDQHVQIFF